MEIAKERSKIYLAGLLHDIGKFYERADDHYVPDSKLLVRSVKDAEGVFCPKRREGKREYYTHRHVLYTLQFFEDHRQLFAGLFNDDKALGLEGKDTLPKLAGKHHRAETVLEKIIQTADWAASGMERNVENTASDQQVEQNLKNYKNCRMHSIFDTLDTDGKMSTTPHTLPVTLLDGYPNLFPVDNDTVPEYAALWQNFDEEFAQLPAGHPDSFGATLLALLEKYTATIPSAANSAPDVSLLDHLKMTAGIAVSIYDYLKDRNELTESGLEQIKNGKPFLLIGADLSGIQSFIYNILSKKAAKNLKGRSFYLQTLIMGALHTLQKETGLPGGCTIYASGGGFFAIGPNTDKVKNAISDLHSKLEKGLFKQHNLRLYLSMAFTELGYEEVFPNKRNTESGLQQAWQRLTQNLNRQKRQRYISLIGDKKCGFFEPFGKGAEENIDAISGEAIPDNLSPVLLQGESDPATEGPVISPLTDRLMTLGASLKKAVYWIMSDQEKVHKELRQLTRVQTPGTKLYHYLVTEDNLKEKISIDNAHVLYLKGTEFLEGENYIQGTANSFDFYFYGGNDFPEMETGEPKTFDELAGPEGAGFRRLGVLRMDVDNLGQIFIRGLPNEKRTLARYATLSRSLDYFFKGYLNKIWDKDLYKDWTMIIYSGGDDLFIVGRWNRLLLMAQEIYRKFREWTGCHPAITLSGGMALTFPRFPVMKGADLSGEAEDQAKSHKYSEKKNIEDEKVIFEKDSFSVLGFPLHWDHELKPVLEQADELARLVKEEKLPATIFQNIHAFYEMAYPDKEDSPGEKDFDPDKEHLRWRWMMAYHFKRMRSRYKNEEAGQLLAKLQKDCITGNTRNGNHISSAYPSLARYRLAARLAELCNRTKDEDNDGLTFKNNT